MKNLRITIWLFLVASVGAGGTGLLYATVTGADKEKPLKKKEAQPDACCTLNYATDQGIPGITLRQICFTRSRTILIINQSPGQNVCYVPSGLHLREDNGRRLTAVAVQGAEICNNTRTKYKTQRRARLIFPAVRRGLKHFSVWEDDVITPPGFRQFRWSKVNLAKCYRARK